MNSDVLKIFRLNIKEYVLDLILLFTIGVLLSIGVNFFYFPTHFELINKFKRDFDIYPLPLAIFIIIFWIILFLIVRLILQKLITLYSLFHLNTYGFNYKKDNKRIEPLSYVKFFKDFYFQGNIQLKDGGLIVTNSHSGCLIKPVPGFFPVNRRWKNFKALLEIEFPKQHLRINQHDYRDGKEYKKTDSESFNDFLGIVFRAQNLDDYLMLELCKVNKRTLLIRPHIRINAEWDAPVLNPDFNAFPIKSGKNNSINLTIIAKSNLVIIVENNKILRWAIPTHAEPNLIRAGKGEGDTLSKTYIHEIHFRGEAGMFGFRNYGNELAFVRSLYISNSLTEEDNKLIDQQLIKS